MHTMVDKLGVKPYQLYTARRVLELSGEAVNDRHNYVGFVFPDSIPL